MRFKFDEITIIKTTLPFHHYLSTTPPQHIDIKKLP